MADPVDLPSALRIVSAIRLNRLLQARLLLNLGAWRPSFTSELLVKGVVAGIMLTVLSGFWYATYEDQYAHVVSFGLPSPWVSYTHEKSRHTFGEHVTINLSGLIMDLAVLEGITITATIVLLPQLRARFVRPGAASQLMETAVALEQTAEAPERAK